MNSYEFNKKVTLFKKDKPLLLSRNHIFVVL